MLARHDDATCHFKDLLLLRVCFIENVGREEFVLDVVFVRFVDEFKRMLHIDCLRAVDAVQDA